MKLVLALALLAGVVLALILWFRMAGTGIRRRRDGEGGDGGDGGDAGVYAGAVSVDSSAHDFHGGGGSFGGGGASGGWDGGDGGGGDGGGGDGGGGGD